MRATPARRKHSFGFSPLATAVAAAIGSGYGGAALAQSSELRRPALEEIVVTASRRETTLHELPFNVAAVDGETLERQRLNGLAEFSRSVPGLVVVDQGPRGADLLSVRGLNVRSLNASEFLGNTGGETVQTYLGDIPLYLDLKMHDIERVEVLIGPQGTLYGAGTLGGAIRYIPRAPDTEAFSLDLRGDLYGVSQSDGTGYRTNAAVNVPLVEDKLAVRAAVSWLDDPGFIDYAYVLREPGVSNPQPDFDDPADVAANLRRVDDADFEQTLSSRVALLWKATDRVQATLSYHFQDQEAGGRSVNHRDALQLGNFESGHRFLEPNDRETDLWALDVVADLGFASLTWASGISQYFERGQRDQTDLLLDFGYGYEDFPAFAAFTREWFEEDRTSQEIRLVSNGTGPWSWIGGVFYNDFDSAGLSQEFTPGFPAFLGLDLPTGDLEYQQTTTDRQTEKAVFGEVTYRFDDSWAVTFGGRFFEYDIEQFVSFDLPIIDLFGIEDLPIHAQDDGFLGKLNVAYSFGPRSLAYLTVSEGYRVGGANPIEECMLPLPAGQNVCALPHERLIDPDTTTNYELGMRGGFSGGRTSFNAAVFHVDWNDIQTLSTTENGNVPITVNGGGARTRGVELALQTRTNGPWSYTASYAYADAELTHHAVGLVDGADAFAGDRLSGSPQHQGSVHANYFRTLSNGLDLDVAYGVTFTSDVLTKVGLRNDGEKLGGFTLHSASVGVGRERWSATLYADNLLDKFAETAVRQDPSFVRDVNGFALRRYFRNVIRPRSVGIEFRYRL